MKTPPDGWPRMSSSLFYENAAKAIDWLCHAFGFEVRLKVEGDGDYIVHSELTFGGGVVMVGSAREGFRKSPRQVGGANTQCICVYVDDADAHCERARAAGAKVTMEPAVHDYGGDWGIDSSYGCEDPEGHNWWFTQRLSGPKA